MARGKIERETVQNRIKEVQEAVGESFVVSEQSNVIQLVSKETFQVVSFPLSHWNTFLMAFKMNGAPVEEKKEGKKTTTKK